MKRKIVLFLLFFVTGYFTYAQTDLKNSDILFISSSTDTLFINGDFTNTSSGTLVNNGSFYVKGNISNDQSTMAAGTGTLYLDGSAAQSVNGSQTFKTYNLVTDNSAGITLNNNLSVSAVHTFTNGLIHSSLTPNYLVYEAGSSYTGDNDSRHVNGWVKKYGTTNFVFPVGNATYERVVAISNLPASSEFNCKYNTPTTNIINLFSPLAMVKPNEYWQLDKISGGTAQVTLNWEHSKVAMDNVLLIDILSSQYSAGYWRSTGGTASGNVTTTGTMTLVALYNRGETATVNPLATMAAICDVVARNTNRYVTADVTASNRTHSRTLTKSDGPNKAATAVDSRYESGKPGSSKSRTGQPLYRTWRARAKVTKWSFSIAPVSAYRTTKATPPTTSAIDVGVRAGHRTRSGRVTLSVWGTTKRLGVEYSR